MKESSFDVPGWLLSTGTLDCARVVTVAKVMKENVAICRSHHLFWISKYQHRLGLENMLHRVNQILRFPLALVILGVFAIGIAFPYQGPTDAYREHEAVLRKDSKVPVNERIDALFTLLGDQSLGWESLNPEGTTIASMAEDILLFRLWDKASSRFRERVKTVENDEIMMGFALLIRRKGMNDDCLRATLQEKWPRGSANTRTAIIIALAGMEVSDMTTDTLLSEALADSDIELVVAALEYARVYEGDLSNSTATLQKLLSDDRWRVYGRGERPIRIDAAYALGQTGTVKPSVLAELERLMDDPDDRMKVAASVAHCRLTKKRDGLELLMRMTTDPWPGFVRELALNGILEANNFRKDDGAWIVQQLESQPDNWYATMTLLEALSLANPDNAADIFERYQTYTSDPYLDKYVRFCATVYRIQASPRDEENFQATKKVLTDPEFDIGYKLGLFSIAPEFGTKSKELLPVLTEFAETAFSGRVQRRARTAIDSITRNCHEN